MSSLTQLRASTAGRVSDNALAHNAFNTCDLLVVMIMLDTTGSGVTLSESLMIIIRCETIARQRVSADRSAITGERAIVPFLVSC